ncbi:hypothetical protein FP2506_15379 [Fulvimarina pelagi HTCC2506]|uniref:Putative restriction endonuclease domain-containing protein n=1 Tax=Fulvimarina pelagi HTCC2506 TaxID=314231 RepID=Q0G3K4_9HYPH|nr:Uma2 family endonuclease [Fulvimarina pelagi]EAU41827.1 hypothetical protein FP2506_15379 [Fulvimarina pelagi HTCC2506]
MSRLREHDPWTKEQFFAWQQDQEERYELVDGFPLKMMTGASNRHDAIVINIIGELRNRLRDKPCSPFSADGAVETYPGQIRRPDAGIDCELLNLAIAGAGIELPLSEICAGVEPQNFQKPVVLRSAREPMFHV